MEVVQWIARRPGDKGLSVRFVPAGTLRLPATAGWPALRRRGPLLSSPHLPHPLVAAVAADVVDDPAVAGSVARAAGGGLLLRTSLATGADDGLAADADDVRFAATFAEFVAVVAALAVAAGLPFVAAYPTLRGQQLDVVLGDVAPAYVAPGDGAPGDVTPGHLTPGEVGVRGRAGLADALILFAVAVRTAALARGFDAAVAVVGGPEPAPIDGRIEETL
jgi:hypothetical protein